MPRSIKAAVVGALVGIIGVILVLTPLGAQFEAQTGLMWLFRMRGAVAPPSDVVVIAIDRSTGNRLDLPESPRDWPRSTHAKIVDRLVELGASTIVFDIEFRQAQSDEEDQAFAEAIKKANRVVLIESLEGLQQNLGDIANWTKSVEITPSNTTPSSNRGDEKTELWIEQRVPPTEVLANAAYGIGAFPVPKTKGAVYQYWAFKTSAGDVPTLPALALQVHGMDAYARWRQILVEARGQDADALPAGSRDIPGATGLQEVMVDLRRAYKRDATLSERVLQITEPSDLPEDQVKLVRALNALYSGDDTRYLNFYGPAGTISTIPYQALAGKEWKSLDVEGKAVFIGFSDIYNPGQQDWFYSVFTSDEGVDLSGVEIASTAFGNLLNGEELIPTGAAAAAVIAFLFGALLAAGIYLFPAIIAVPVALGIASLYGLGAQNAFSTMNLWLPLATPLVVQLPTAIFLGLLSNYLLERRKKREITEAIAYYLPEHVMADLGRGSFDPDSMNKVVYAACLSTDMADFSSIAETMSPKQAASFINEYFDALSGPLKKHNVSVTEFRADAIMCAWTAPQPEEGVRRAALLAALEARDAMLRFGENTRIHLVPRVGLEADFVYIGHAGGGGHFVYSIVGDAANTASRVESLNTHLNTQLLATETVTAGMKGFQLRPLGRFRLKGKKDAVSVVEVIAQAATTTGEQHLLCRQFAQALASFRSERWREAANRFEAILEQFHNDGPSRFYLDRSRQCARRPPETDEPAVIYMEAK